MRTCPICGKAEIKTRFCEECGFDMSTDVASFPTLCAIPPSVTAAREAARQRQLAKNGAYAVSKNKIVDGRMQTGAPKQQGGSTPRAGAYAAPGGQAGNGQAQRGTKPQYRQPGQARQGKAPQYQQPGQPRQGQAPQYQQPGQARQGQAPQYQQPGQARQGKAPQYQQPGQARQGTAPQYQQPGQVRQSTAIQYQQPGQVRQSTVIQYQQPGQARQGTAPQYQQPGQAPLVPTGQPLPTGQATAIQAGAPVRQQAAQGGAWRVIRIILGVFACVAAFYCLGIFILGSVFDYDAAVMVGLFLLANGFGVLAWFLFRKRKPRNKR